MTAKRARTDGIVAVEDFNQLLLEQAGYAPICGAAEMIMNYEQMLDCGETHVNQIHVDQLHDALDRLMKLVRVLRDESARELFLRMAVIVFEILAPSARVDSCYLAAIKAAVLRNAKIVREKSITAGGELTSTVGAIDSLLETLSEIGGKCASATADAWWRAQECCITAAAAIERCNRRKEHTCDLPMRFFVLAEACGHEASTSEYAGQRIAPATLGASERCVDCYLQSRKV